LIDQDLLSENSVLLEQAMSDNKFKLSSEQMANMLCGVNEENWEEKIDRGKRIPNETLKSQQFWLQLWEMIGEEQSPLIRERANTRFFTNPEMLNAITVNFEPNVLDGLSEEQVAFIGVYLREKPEAFNIESTLLMKAATSSDSRIYEKAFSHLEEIGLQSKFALGLLESDFPRAIEEATLFFKELDTSSPEFLEDLLSLCDSPNLSARSLGLEVLETSQDHIPLAKIIVSLKESRHPDIRHFVATKLSANSELLPNSLDFDISVLKSRNVERTTKELVKERLQQGMPLNLEALNESLLKTLREMSQGLVEKDKEWAIKQLTGIKARGAEVPDLQIQEIEE
jgi:hypothetical protein